MTARELLREVADWIDRRVGFKHIDAAALRALADRMDAEERDLLRHHEMDDNTQGLHVIARLDAPLTPAPVPTVCASWCGTTCGQHKNSIVQFWYRRGDEPRLHFCEEACRDAARPLHPATPGER